ncbi:MAG: transglycosylase domain-containing protein [Bacilli bacterium]|nr:transglycosylase domain-containing protein [Bacilli bacterium]
MKILRNLYKLGIFLFISCIVVIVGLYLYAYLSSEITLNTANFINIYDKDDNIVFQGNGNKEWVNLNEVSEDVKNAMVSIEDKNFYKHHGFDYLRIIKSLLTNIKEKKITAGASTISMQYVKNMYLDFDQTWERKFDEAFLTMNLEVHYDKDEILEGYLNTINFGQGNFGIENASQYYFNKKSSDLTLEEAIILVGIPRSPENYNPISNYELSIKRAKTVAQSMVKNGYISEETYDNLFQEEIIIHGKEGVNKLQTLMYYQDAVLSELNSLTMIPKSLIKSGGLKIYTNLSIETQTEMEKSIIANITNEKAEVASIVIEPNTGGVMALAGGVDYSKSQYNRVTQAKRQVGSVIKPFLYYGALENNMTSASTFRSELTSFVFADNQKYSPTNYANIYGNRNITMAAALSYSDNIYAVKTHLFLGEDILVNTLKLAGLKGNLAPNPSLALGASEFNMLDFAGAYNTLANNGTYNELFFIRRVEDTTGKVIYKHKDNPEDVLNKDYTFIINEMMTNTYNSHFIDYATPTVLSLGNRVDRKFALKSGTTDYDYWIVGYNPDFLMMVWSGNDLNESVDSSISSKIKEIWYDTTSLTLKNTPSSWYEMPDNIVAMPLHSITGIYEPTSSKSTLFYFKKGSEPDFFED